MSPGGAVVSGAGYTDVGLDVVKDVEKLSQERQSIDGKAFMAGFDVSILEHFKELATFAIPSGDPYYELAFYLEISARSTLELSVQSTLSLVRVQRQEIRFDHTSAWWHASNRVLRGFQDYPTASGRTSQLVRPEHSSSGHL
jgi:hypothetical protein